MAVKATDSARLRQLKVEREPIGRGAGGAVYRAEDPVTHQKVALKELFDADGLDAEAAASQAVSDSPWFPEYFGRLGNRLGFEWVEGKPVSQLEKSKAVRVAINVAHALHDLHAAGYVHGDVNPANVLINAALETKSVKLLDLGGARKLGADGHWRGQERIGSWAYGAPEGNYHPTADRPTVLSPATDTYALLGVLVYMLTGKEAFPGAREAGRAENWPEFERIHDECAVAKSIEDPALRALLLRGLSRDPASRFQTAEELIAALRPFAG